MPRQSGATADDSAGSSGGSSTGFEAGVEASGGGDDTDGDEELQATRTSETTSTAQRPPK
jgi:hypothetical protein